MSPSPLQNLRPGLLLEAKPHTHVPITLLSNLLLVRHALFEIKINFKFNKACIVGRARGEGDEPLTICPKWGNGRQEFYCTQMGP